LTCRFHNDGRGHPDHPCERLVLGARSARDKRRYHATKVPACSKIAAIPNRFFIVQMIRLSAFFLLTPALNTQRGWIGRSAMVRRSGVHALLTLIRGALIRRQPGFVAIFRENNFACGKP
jgi:hypothetical protein